MSNGMRWGAQDSSCAAGAEIAQLSKRGKGLHLPLVQLFGSKLEAPFDLTASTATHPRHSSLNLGALR